MRVTGQESLWPSNMPPSRSRASPGGSPISVPGAASMVLATPSASCGFSASTRTRQTPALLLKLLFTSEPLSIQVHPDDAFARSIGLAERQDRSLVYPLGNAGRAGCARTEAAPHASGIARRDQGRLDCRLSLNGVPSRKATSSSSPPARSTPSAPVSCSPRFSSTATRHSVCSTMAGSANCTKTAPSPSPMRGRFKLKPFRGVSPRPERP